MKRGILLLLVASIVLTMPVMASNTSKNTGFYDIGTNTDMDIKVLNDNAPVTQIEADVDEDGALEKWYPNSNRIGVTYKDAVAGGNYGVLLVEGNSVPTVGDDIFYIDQVEAKGATVDFDVYPILPKETTGMTLYISSDIENFDLVRIPLKYLVADISYVLGDVNGDGKFNVEDALIVLKIGIGDYPDVTNEIRAAADVNRDGSWDVIDALMILKRSVGDIDSFE